MIYVILFTIIAKCMASTSALDAYAQEEELPSFQGEVDPSVCLREGITCFNGGYCALEIGLGNEGSSVETSSQPFCRCPIDFTGGSCQTKITWCNTSYLSQSQPNFCLNNGKCVMEGEQFNSCDCSSALAETTNGDLKIFSGAYCEHPHDTLCGGNEDPVLAAGTGEFCTNNGLCKETENGSFQCVCVSQQWTGDHCEFESQFEDETEELLSSTDAISNDNSEVLSSGEIIAISAVAITLVIVFGLYVYRQTIKKYQVQR